MGALGNSPRTNTVFTLERGKSFAFGLRFLDKQGNPLNLVGASTLLTVRNPKRFGGGITIEKYGDPVSPLLGLHQFNLQDNELNLPRGEYPFALTLTSSISYVTLVAKGVLDIQDNASSTTIITDDYPGINPGTNLAVYIEQGNLLEVIVDKVDGLSVIIDQKILDFQAQAEAYLATAVDAVTQAQSAKNAAIVAKNKAEAAAAEAARGSFTETFSLDFPAIPAGRSEVMTSFIAGAVLNDVVVLGTPVDLPDGLIWVGRVVFADNVEVRLFNGTGAVINPGAGTWRITILR